jgi:hypothetical protein
MRLRTRLTAAAATVGLAATTALAATPAGAADGPDLSWIEPGSVAAQLAGATGAPEGNPYDYDVLLTAVIALTGDEDATLRVLGDLDFSGTVFAPNDRAFEVLAKTVGNLEGRYGATVDEAAIVAEVLEIVGGDLDALEDIVLYHATVAGNFRGADVLRLFGKPAAARTLPMVNGDSLRVDVLSPLPRFPIIVLRDNDGRYFNDFVVRSQINAITTETATVHGISDVLLP